MVKKTLSCSVSEGVNPYHISYSMYLTAAVEAQELAYPSAVKRCGTAPGYRVRRRILYDTIVHAIPQPMHLVVCPGYALLCLCHDLSACPHT